MQQSSECSAIALISNKRRAVRLGRVEFCNCAIPGTVVCFGDNRASINRLLKVDWHLRAYALTCTEREWIVMSRFLSFRAATYGQDYKALANWTHHSEAVEGNPAPRFSSAGGGQLLQSGRRFGRGEAVGRTNRE